MAQVAAFDEEWRQPYREHRHMEGPWQEQNPKGASTEIQGNHPEPQLQFRNPAYPVLWYLGPLGEGLRFLIFKYLRCVP